MDSLPATVPIIESNPQAENARLIAMLELWRLPVEPVPEKATAAESSLPADTKMADASGSFKERTHVSNS